MESKLERYMMKFGNPDERLGKVCPKCGSTKIVFLQYGLGWDEELQPLIDSGDAVPMGCVVGDQNLACRDCEYGWASVKWEDF